MQEILKALLPGIADGDMHTPAHRLAILISIERKGLCGSYFLSFFFFYKSALHSVLKVYSDCQAKGAVLARKNTKWSYLGHKDLWLQQEWWFLEQRRKQHNLSKLDILLNLHDSTDSSSSTSFHCAYSYTGIMLKSAFVQWYFCVSEKFWVCRSKLWTLAKNIMHVLHVLSFSMLHLSGRKT